MINTQTQATLKTGNQKFQCEIVEREQLRAYPVPPATSRWRPIPHAELVSVLIDRLAAIGLQPRAEQYAVSKSGMALFGTLDLEGWDQASNQTRSMALGFRHSNDKNIAVQVVGGTRVFVCDNMALSGEKIALRKHTRGLHLASIIREGLSKWADAYRRFEQSIIDAEFTSLTDDQVKVKLFDLRYTGVLPVSIFDEASTNYFKAETLGYEDSAPRTAWGLHNACTRAVKALAPTTQFKVLTALGREFGLGSNN